MNDGQDRQIDRFHICGPPKNTHVCLCVRLECQTEGGPRPVPDSSICVYFLCISTGTERNGEPGTGLK